MVKGQTYTVELCRAASAAEEGHSGTLGDVALLALGELVPNGTARSPLSWRGHGHGVELFVGLQEFGRRTSAQVLRTVKSTTFVVATGVMALLTKR